MCRVSLLGLSMVSETMKLRLCLNVSVESFNLACCLAIGLQVMRVERIHGFMTSTTPSWAIGTRKLALIPNDASPNHLIQFLLK